MDNIKKALDDLETLDRDAIMDAFNQMQSHLIKLPGDHFLAVHTPPMENMLVLEEANYWSFGKFKE